MKSISTNFRVEEVPEAGLVVVPSVPTPSPVLGLPLRSHGGANLILLGDCVEPPCSSVHYPCLWHE